MPQQFIVDAFEAGPFTGNPAAVVPLENWLDHDMMQSIAAENNLSETAFFVPEGESFGLRWFTPTHEVPLCGHATLASAHVCWAELGTNAEELRFATKSGELGVRQAVGRDRYTLNFPIARLETHSAGSDVLAALGVDGEVHLSEHGAFVVTDADALRSATPDFDALQRATDGLAILTAPADRLGNESGFDVLVRVFAPGYGIPEDPATGAAHCAVAPYWVEKIGRNVIKSFQASARGGHFECEVSGERVLITGGCRTFSRGQLAGI